MFLIIYEILVLILVNAGRINIFRNRQLIYDIIHFRAQETINIVSIWAIIQYRLIVSSVRHRPDHCVIPVATGFDILSYSEPSL